MTIQALPARRSKSPLDQRRAEREFFFWTARQVLMLTRHALIVVMVTAIVVYVIVQLCEGHIVVSVGGLLHRWL